MTNKSIFDWLRWMFEGHWLNFIHVMTMLILFLIINMYLYIVHVVSVLVFNYLR